MAFSQQTGEVPSGLYDFGRENGAPSYYDENHTPWMADILEAGFISAGVILLVAFYSILPGVHGKERVFNFMWVTASVFVFVSIPVVIYSKEWEVAESHSVVTKYKAGTGEDIKATLGVHTGLTGVNVTMKGEPQTQLNETINYNEEYSLSWRQGRIGFGPYGEPQTQLNETINYNEEYSWSWRQGRIGFGPYASEFNQEYRASQFRGAPLPILWIAEYFTFDGEGIRWGRFYRVAGLYSFMSLWLAFGLWFLTNILCFILLRYAAYCSILTGAFMCTANVLKHTLRNVNELAIPFSTEHILRLHYGVAFWLCLGTGCFCILAGLVVLVMDLRLPVHIAKFFSQDALQDEKLLDREDTSVSQESNESDLTQIVEVDSNGKRIVKRATRPPGAPPTNSHAQQSSNMTGRNLDDVYNEDQWSDCSSSDVEATDEEDYAPQPSKEKRKASGLDRFQRPRRPVSAALRNSNKRFTTSRPQPFNIRHKGRVSPTSQNSQTSNKDGIHNSRWK